jgi:hypothetical protein
MKDHKIKMGGQKKGVCIYSWLSPRSVKSGCACFVFVRHAHTTLASPCQRRSEHARVTKDKTVRSSSGSVTSKGEKLQLEEQTKNGQGENGPALSPWKMEKSLVLLARALAASTCASSA